MCLKSFPSPFSTAPDYSGFDRSSWKMRSIDTHCDIAQHVHSANIRSTHERAEKEAGIRYSDLVRLPYFDIVCCRLESHEQFVFRVH